MSADPSSLLPPLRLKKNEERRLRAGHPWIFSNEVDTRHTPLAPMAAGQQVCVEAHNGKVLGNAYVNPASLICARVFSRDPARVLDRSLIVHRLKVALALRERLFDAPFYRLVHGEADFLPGLVIDRYGDICVVQCSTAGMEVVREAVVEALQRVISPAGILIKADASVRRLEGLDSYQDSLGKVPEFIDLEENGVRYRVSLSCGQKTGWFYDQRMNRSRLRNYVAGRRVLDLFSYVGGWGMQAAAGGASEVVCVDTSQQALELVGHNAASNGFNERVTSLQGEAFEVLSRLRTAYERFDVVVADPPAFIKRRKDHKSGLQAYHRLNQLAMQVLSKDGILVSASCSYHLAEAQLQKVLLQTARHLDRSLQLLERGHQGPDHPVHPAIAETAYLKALFCRVLPA